MHENVSKKTKRTDKRLSIQCLNLSLTEGINCKVFLQYEFDILHQSLEAKDSVKTHVLETGELLAINHCFLVPVNVYS